MNQPVRIAVTGTHSTGKSTLVQRLAIELRAEGYTVAQTPGSLANQAAALGMPKMQRQTRDTTAWIIASGVRAEAEAASLGDPDVVLIDRSCLDPLAYYTAAQRAAGTHKDHRAWEYLLNLSLNQAAWYDVLLATKLDRDRPPAAGRDGDLDYRAAVDIDLHAILIDNCVPHEVVYNNAESRAEAIATACAALKRPRAAA